MAIESSNRPFLSIIIPVHNGSATIGTCLEALFQSTYTDFEAIVVDDRSTDGSADIIRQHPCTLITITGDGGASVARNRGAAAARGDVLFFIDADCVLSADTLEKVVNAFHRNPDAVTGGTYTPKPYDQGLFSLFQSVFINYSESKRAIPDYVATHAMIIKRSIFIERGAFSEDFMPILEDVEFSHRLRRQGIRLLMAPEIMVQHIFHFTLGKSFRNAFKKTRYWIRYSMKNKDLGTDSGTASLELKANGMAWLASMLLVIVAIVTGSFWPIIPVAVIQTANLMLNIKFLNALRKTGTPPLALGAIMYYLFFYSAPIWAGTIAGLMDVWSGKSTDLRETT